MKRKVTVVGSGNVGATVAQRIVDSELADVVLVDVVEGLPQGKALDMLQGAPVEGSDAYIIGANDYSRTVASDVIVITAGATRGPGMSRDDLLATNQKIVAECVQNATPGSPSAILIVVSNPLDAMCHVALKTSGFPKRRVMGMAGVLDSARLRAFIAMELGVSVENVHACVLGGHGDAMVPLARLSTVAGVPVTELLPPERVDAILKRTAGGGAEIVSLLKKGSAYYAPGAAIFEMVDALLNDKHKVLPCSCFLDGEYGIKGLFVGVPAQLGAEGIEKIWELKLTAEEQAALRRSADGVQELVDAMARLRG
jgi:malate dehydrogenase